MTRSSPIVEVSGLSKSFGAFQAVNDLSFSVMEGDVFGFLGQNGAGKSTTIRMLLSLVRPSAGRIRIHGMDMETHRREILSRVGAVIESPDLYTYLSGYENLEIFARLSGMKPERKVLMEKLDQVGLGSRGRDKVRAYSQGMKQRLGIAVAMVHEPSLVILDEPTNGLDPQGIADIRNLIRVMGKEKTVLLSTHIMQEVEALCDRVIIINKGRIVANDSTAVLQQQSGTTITITVEFDRSVTRQQLSRINGVKNMSSANPTTW